MESDDIKSQDQISAVGGQAVLDTLENMFGLKLFRNPDTSFPLPADVVLAGAKMTYGATELDFYFRFDKRMLLQVASFLFSPEDLKDDSVPEALACEVVNIVCHKVIAALSKEGCEATMRFPFVFNADQTPPLEKEALPYMTFLYHDEDGKEAMGLTINYTVT